jgi:hypothetical protein
MNTMKIVLGIPGNDEKHHARGLKAPSVRTKSRFAQVRTLHDAAQPGWNLAANSTFGERTQSTRQICRDEAVTQDWNNVERWVRRSAWIVVVAATIVDLAITFAPAGVRFL